MFQLDIQLKFWELLFALVAAAIVVIGAIFVAVNVVRRRMKPALYVEAGGVVLSVGEERLLEHIARSEGKDQNLFALARSLNADQIAVYAVARELKRKDLIVEVPDLSGGSPRFELSEAGNAAALARNYIQLAI
jgi:DNA-binding MarR family transcriptional regulator